METECVVCGSQNDLRSLRCFVCGAELPPVSVANEPHEAILKLTSVQGLAPPVKVPLSVGALPLKEILSKRPVEYNLKEQDISHDRLDVLLGPEDLSPLIQSYPISTKVLYEPSGAPSGAPSGTPSGAPSGVPSDVLGGVPGGEVSENAIDDAPDTWIGVPIPEIKQDSKTESSTRKENIGSVYSPISRLLEGHNRHDKSSKKGVEKNIEIPRKEILTGADLKQLEQEATPSRWELGELEDSSVSLSSVRALQPVSDDEEERETALKISIPEILAVDQSSQPSERIDFVPMSSLPHSKVISPISEPDTDTDTSLSKADEHKSSSNPFMTMEFEVSRPHKAKKTLSSLSWFLLTLSSIAVGVVIALYNMPQHSSDIETTLDVAEITHNDDVHYIKLNLFAQPKATLIVPDSYLSPSQAPMIEVIGKAELLLQVPNKQLHLGRNMITLQWAYDGTADQHQRFLPIDVAIPLNYKKGNVAYDAKRDVYLLKVILRSGLTLIDSDFDFESSGQADEYIFVIPKNTLKGAKEAVAKATLQGSDDEQIKATFTYDLPKDSVPLTILSPVNRYARPDQSVLVMGRVSPLAQISVSDLSRAGISVESQPNLTVKADGLGIFSLSIPLGTKASQREGDLWKVTLSSVGLSGSSQSQTVEFKQSYAPTWHRYVKRLSTRKDKAKVRYRQFIHKKLMASPDKYESKAGMVEGVIAFIDRGSEDHPQRLLIYTCQNNNECPVWVEDKDAFWVKLGQKISVFGVMIGQGAYLDAKGIELNAPEIRARLTTP